MRRISLILGLLIATGTAALAADQMLVGWDFSQAADVKKWDATHSLAPFVAAEGVLKTRATDGDPYMIAAGAKAFDVEGNDFQYLEIKLKCDKNGGGEFFWANTAEGKDLGFMAGQEIPFSIKGDGAFHLYRIFPGWTGHVSRLRFDPPEGTAIEIASLRLMQAPVTRHDPLSRRWDFGADGAGGFVPTSGCLYDPVADGLKVTLDSTDAVLIGPAVTWKAADSRWLTLHLTTAAPLQLTLKWATNPEGRFGGSDLLSVDVARGEQYLTLDLAELAGWTGSVTRLALSLTGAPGDALTLHSLGVSPQPEGPPRLKVLSFATDRAIMAAGESVKLVLRCRNDGGAPARELRATLTATGSPASLSLPSP
ncbi:MAG: hypothetical protein WCP21_16890, partial [Armatimonadota bacterium]